MIVHKLVGNISYIAESLGMPLNSIYMQLNNYPRINAVFHDIVNRYADFSNCTGNKSFYRCNSNEGFSLRMTPSEFFMGFMHKNVPATCSLSLASDSDSAYSWLCRHKGVTYELSEAINGTCTDSYFRSFQDGFDGSAASECKNGVPLFDKFLSGAKFENPSFFKSIWSMGKIYAGATLTLTFGYGTLMELNKLWKAFKEIADKNKSVQLQSEKFDLKNKHPEVALLVTHLTKCSNEALIRLNNIWKANLEKSDLKNTHPEVASFIGKLLEQQLENSKALVEAKKGVLTCSIITLASLIFTATTYWTDFTEPSGDFYTKRDFLHLPSRLQ